LRDNLHDNWIDTPRQTNMSAKRNTPIVVSDEQNEVKIYTVKGRTGSLYQVAYYRAGERIRKSFADLNEAKREARLQLGVMAGERIQARNLSPVEMESHTMAVRRLEPTGVPLHVCAELYSAAHTILKGHSIVDAAKYYMRHFDPERPRKPLRELAVEFVESRQASGCSQKYIVTARTTMRMLLRARGTKSLDDLEPSALDEMMEARKLRNRSRNSYRIILVCFGNFLKKRGYLPKDKPTAFDGMTTWRNEVDPVSIYTPEEMSRMLSRAHAGVIPFIAIGAFAGLRTAEICRLEWSHVRFNRGFIECAAGMTKTRSRRLVPISENLRAWLEPLARSSGPVVEYRNMDQAMRRFHQSNGLEWKRNALRHSYISYRLAEVADTARVALECGNSPDVIFKHYRELVTPEQAGGWFSLMPPAGYPASAPHSKSGMIGKKRNWRNLKLPHRGYDELKEVGPKPAEASGVLDAQQGSQSL
jgi:integrase